MRYLWTEDTGAGLHFWKLVNKFFFDNELVVESKGSNQGLLDAVIDLDIKDDDKYYVAFDYVVDNQDIRNKYRMLKSITDKSEGKIVILDMICFEYLILAFDKLIAWTGTGKTDKIKIREEVLAAVENHRINLSKIDDEKTLQYIAGFKRYSTERVMKSLAGATGTTAVIFHGFITFFICLIHKIIPPFSYSFQIFTFIKSYSNLQLCKSHFAPSQTVSASSSSHPHPQSQAYHI